VERTADLRRIFRLFLASKNKRKAVVWRGLREGAESTRAAWRARRGRSGVQSVGGFFGFGSAKAVPGRRFSAEALGLGRISMEGPAVYLGFRASSTCIVVSCSFALGGRGLWQPKSSALSLLPC
jgi:hypothetical protein